MGQTHRKISKREKVKIRKRNKENIAPLYIKKDLHICSIKNFFLKTSVQLSVSILNIKKVTMKENKVCLFVILCN